MKVISVDKSIRAIRGRVGDYVFRTYHNSDIRVFYSPRPGKRTTPPLDPNKDYLEIKSRLYREILRPLHLQFADDHDA